MLSMYGKGASGSVDAEISASGGAGEPRGEGLGGLGENLDMLEGIGDGLGGACGVGWAGVLRKGARVMWIGIMDSQIVFCICDIVPRDIYCIGRMERRKDSGVLEYPSRLQG